MSDKKAESTEIRVWYLYEKTKDVKKTKEAFETIFKDIAEGLGHKFQGGLRFEAYSEERADMVVGDPISLHEKCDQSFERSIPAILLLDDLWDEKTREVLQAPRFDVRGIFRLPKVRKEGRDAEDFAALSSAVKDIVRQVLRSGRSNLGTLHEEDFAKPITWKARTKDASGFTSLFSDPTMQRMSKEYKDSLLGLKGNGILMQLRDNKAPKFGKNPKSKDQDGRLENFRKDMAKHLSTHPSVLVRGMRIPSILLLGETGCGKTLLARAAAKALTDSEEHFFKVNISAYTKSAIDTTLFGAEKGSYTGAEHDQPGVFIAHCGGVVFLDEIGDMDAECQTRLLTYMDDGKVTPRGMSEAIFAPCYLIAATNKDVDNPASGFRQDIVHRFDHVIRIPPLRERKQDLRLLISLTLQDDKINPPKKIKMESGSPNAKDIQPEDRRVSRISLDAIEYLEGYDFPGNFRQLEFILRQAVNQAFAEGADCLCLRHVKDKR